jgi:hypothetical protein
MGTRLRLCMIIRLADNARHFPTFIDVGDSRKTPTVSIKHKSVMSESKSKLIQLGDRKRSTSMKRTALERISWDIYREIQLSDWLLHNFRYIIELLIRSMA